MRTLLIVIAVVIVLGGGFYWYTSMQQPTATAPTTSTTDNSGAAMNTTNTAPTDNGSAMEDGTVPEGSSNTGASVNTKVDVGATTGASTGATKSFTVTGQNFSFTPSTLSVKKGDTVKITFKMASGTSHDFVIDAFNVRTNRLEAGDAQTVTFVADKAGSFEYYCSVGQHRAMGMKGTLTVTP